MAHKILAIDDHPQTLDIVIITLQQNGYLAIGSNSPREAITLAEQEQPDLVLLDMNMPEIDGKELCRQFRAHPKFADIPIIMFSAEASEKLASFQVGADDFLVKPTDPDELIARIEALLEAPDGTGSSKEIVSTQPSDASPMAEERQGGAATAFIPPQPRHDKRLIAVLGVRGGSGATTMATNLAVCVAGTGRATTLVDLDLQQGHIGIYLKIKAIGGINMLSLLQDSQLRQRLPQLLVRYNDNLNLLLTKPNLYGRHPKPSPAQMAIVLDTLMRPGNCVVVDLGHEITNVAGTVLDGADQVIVCLRPERISLSIAKGLMSQLRKSLYEHTTLRAVMFATVGGMNLPRDAVERFLGHPLLAVIPPQPREMTQATNKGVPFVQLYPQANVAKLYQLLAQELVKT